MSEIGATKQSISDLAIFGGVPTFTRTLHVGRPNIGDRSRFLERLSGALDRHVLTNNGPLVREFEERIAEMIGTRHAIAVANATVGLQVAAKAVHLEGEVIVPSFSFIATAHALEWVGLEPVFADIDATRLTIDPIDVERLIGPRTSGILATHLWGRTCEVERLEAIAEAHGLRLLFDAAHAFTCTRDGRMVGGFGDAEVFSFHATKFVNAFEGGLIATNDDDIAARSRLLRNHGFASLDKAVSFGTNGKMSEVSAAMGLTSLDALDEIVAVNRRNLELYSEHLGQLEGVRMHAPDERGDCNSQYVVIRLDQDSSPLARDQVRKILEAEGARVRRYFFPGCHRMEPYASRPAGPPSLPVTERLADEVLVLPTGTGVTEAEIVALCGLVGFALNHAASIRERWALAN